MAQFLGSVAMMRPDAVSVWKDPEVNRRLYWYRQVMLGRFPAKYQLCRKVTARSDLRGSSDEDLWREHEHLSEEASELVTDFTKGSEDGWALEDGHPNLLDVKSELANRMLTRCSFCEWNCQVNRAEGEIGFCRLDKTTLVCSYFHHYGEEAPLTGINGRGGSGTIFFESCTARCVYCQNWDISQPKTKTNMTGEVATPLRLAEIAEHLARGGAANINYVGGEPTPNLHAITNSLQHMTTNVPLIWNSNMYCSMETMKILADLIDLWLPDFKYWKDDCARRLMLVGGKASYPEVVKRNHLFAADHGSMIVRHLVMPGHVECCSKPILDFISQTIGDRVLVNVMAQYHPDNLVTRNPEKYADIARRLSREEIQEAYAHARALGIQTEQVS